MSMQVDPEAPAPQADGDASSDIDPAARARQRRTVGVVLLVIGLVVAAVAAWSLLRDDGPPERRVGKLTASHLGADQGGSTPRPTSSGSNGGSGGGSTPPATTAPDAGTTATTAPGGAKWPGYVRGRPAKFGADGDAPPSTTKGLADGFYLWQDFQGWHLWQVGGNADAKAEVVVDNEIPRAEGVGGSPEVATDGNHLVVSRGGESAPVTGADFSAGFYAKTMVVTVTGANLYTGSNATKVAPLLGISFSPYNR